MHNIFAILLTICSLVASESQQNLDIKDVLPYLNICLMRKLRSIELCIQDNINLMHLSFLSGVPQLDIPSFETYTIHHYEVNLTELSNGSTTFENMSIHGLTNYHINGVMFYADKNQLFFTACFPRITTVADYNINGTPADIILKKQGKMTLIISDIEADVVTTYYTTYENLNRYFRVNKVIVRMRIGDVFLNFNNLTDIVSNKNYSLKTKLNLLRQNWREILPNMVYDLELLAADFIKTTANKIYSKFPEIMLTR